MNDDLWDRVRGLGSETWKGCEWVELLVVLTRLRGTGIISICPTYSRLSQLPTQFPHLQCFPHNFAPHPVQPHLSYAEHEPNHIGHFHLPLMFFGDGNGFRSVEHSRPRLRLVHPFLDFHLSTFITHQSCDLTPSCPTCLDPFSHFWPTIAQQIYFWRAGNVPLFQ